MPKHKEFLLLQVGWGRPSSIRGVLWGMHFCIVGMLATLCPHFQLGLSDLPPAEIVKHLPRLGDISFGCEDLTVSVWNRTRVFFFFPFYHIDFSRKFSMCCRSSDSRAIGWLLPGILPPIQSRYTRWTQGLDWFSETNSDLTNCPEHNVAKRVIVVNYDKTVDAI